MTRAFLDLPLFRRRRLAAALENGSLGNPFTAASLRATVGVGGDGKALIEALKQWEELGVSGRAKAAWLRSLDEAEGRRATADFVWSGPEVRGLHSRKTAEVLEEALSGARSSVWLSTYVYYDGPKVFETLAKRMDEAPALTVTLLLNVERKPGDTTRAEDLLRRYAERFRKDWPGKRLPRLFYDPRSIQLDGPAGVLHAKALVVDNELVFITSANLTEAALDRNIEMGILLRDRSLATTVARHLNGLIERDVLSSLPAV